MFKQNLKIAIRTGGAVGVWVFFCTFMRAIVELGSPSDIALIGLIGLFMTLWAGLFTFMGLSLVKISQ